VLDDPSPPVTLSATSTALGIVNVCATLVQVISNIILPSEPLAGRLVKDSVTDSFDDIKDSVTNLKDEVKEIVEDTNKTVKASSPTK